MLKQPLRVAVIGAGGFARQHHAVLHGLEKQGLRRLMCTCDPFADRLHEAERLRRFVERHVRPFHNCLFQSGMLAQNREGLEEAL